MNNPRLYERRLNEFKKNISSKKGIVNYFQIKNLNDITFQNESNNSCKLTIKYKHVNFDINKNNIFELPAELNDVISTYLPSYIKITLTIKYPPDYPFKPPTWSLTELSHNINLHADVEEYYSSIVDAHNRENREWLPSTWVEKDVILFISRINHFDSVMRETL